MPGTEQRPAEFFSAGKAIVGVGSEGPFYHTLQPVRHPGFPTAKLGWLSGEVLGDHRLGSRSGEGWLSSQTLVEHATERVEIAPAIDLSLPGGLLGTHIGRRADRKAGPGQPVAARCTERMGDPEVGQNRFTSLEQDVLRFDVPMDDAVLMSASQGSEDVTSHPYGVLQRETPLTVQSLAERFAFDIWHCVPELAGGLARVEEREDVWMTEFRGESDLEEKPLGSKGRRQLRMQDLERHRTLVLQILR